MVISLIFFFKAYLYFLLMLYGVLEKHRYQFCVQIFKAFLSPSHPYFVSLAINESITVFGRVCRERLDHKIPVQLDSYKDLSRFTSQLYDIL